MRKKRAPVDSEKRQSRATAAVMDTELGPNPTVVGQDEQRRQGKGMNYTEAVAQDGNSIESNDSRQMIIRKDVTWAVEYSAP